MSLLINQCCGSTYLSLAAEIEATLQDEYAVDVWKALDPLKDRDFVIIFTRLRAKLEKEAKPIEVAAVAAALDALDVDWPSITPKARARAAEAANKAVRAVTKTIAPAVDPILIEDHLDISGKTKASVKKTHKFDIATSMTRTDDAIAKRASKAQGNFITHEYGLRATNVEQTACNVVADGLTRGLGRNDIATELNTAIPAQIIGRSPAYWNVVAASFTNRARTYTQLGSFQDAGIATYVFEAVLDRQTTETCRFLHGRQWSVNVARDRMTASDKARDSVAVVKNDEPWMHTGFDNDGQKILYTKDQAGNRTIIADVLRSAEGKADKVGQYRQRVSNAKLESSGIPYPPRHGL